MRILRINDINVDIDDETAIGIDFQSYDVSQPGKNFINISNTFTIPLTSNNKAIFGNAENHQSLSTQVYEENICNYWVDNNQLIKDAKCRVDKIDDRINLFIFQKDDIWDILKSVSWYDFLFDFLIWGDTVKGWPGYSVSNPITSKLIFTATFADATEGIVMPMYFGNFKDFDPTGSGNLDIVNRIYLKYDDSLTYQSGNGGHFCIYVKSIFEYIEYTYDVNFLTSGGVLPGNIWDDLIADSMYVPARELLFNYIGNPASSLWIQADQYRKFYPFTDQRDKADKTLYDFVNSFFQHFNILIDKVDVNGEDVFRLARFDDLETIADVEDWSGNLSGTPIYKPFIEDINQINFIKFSEIYPEGDSLLNSKELNCNNINLDYKKDLFNIDAYINSVYDITGTGEYIPDLSNKVSFKTFSFFVSNGQTTGVISIDAYSSANGGGQNMGSRKLFIPELYNLNDEYNFYDDIIEYPKFYEIKKWLKESDLKNFEFFKQYFIRELNGSFFVNKISGYNPDKSKEPTTIELIRISDKTPIADPDLDYFTDGVADAFTDGDSDYFF